MIESRVMNSRELPLKNRLAYIEAVLKTYDSLHKDGPYKNLGVPAQIVYRDLERASFLREPNGKRNEKPINGRNPGGGRILSQLRGKGRRGVPRLRVITAIYTGDTWQECKSSILSKINRLSGSNFSVAGRGGKQIGVHGDCPRPGFW